jgi:hypothetical protein
MLVIGTFDFIAAAMAEINSDDPMSGRFTAILVLAAITSPCFFAFLPSHDTSNYQQALVAMSLSLPLAVAYLYLRRSQIQALRLRIGRPIPSKVRAIGALAMFAAALASALAARHSTWAAVAALLMVACLPWASWSGLQRAP